MLFIMVYQQKDKQTYASDNHVHFTDFNIQKFNKVCLDFEEIKWYSSDVFKEQLCLLNTF